MVLNAVTASVISRVLQQENVMVNATDLELLEALYHENKPLKIEEISKKFNLDIELAKSIISKLKDEKFVEPNSPTYKISELGKQLINLVYAILPTAEKKVNQDTYLRILSSCSSTIVQ